MPNTSSCCIERLEKHGHFQSCKNGSYRKTFAWFSLVAFTNGETKQLVKADTTAVITAHKILMRSQDLL